jgi:hypothetical protein
MPVGSRLIPLTAIAAIAFTKGPSAEAMISEQKVITGARERQRKGSLSTRYPIPTPRSEQ